VVREQALDYTANYVNIELGQLGKDAVALGLPPWLSTSYFPTAASRWWRERQLATSEVVLTDG